MATNNSSISSAMEEVLTFPKPQQDQRRLRAQPDQALKCPRCDSTNTKFCYYNNYSLSQPRYFCKGCRRYWTQGGTLRNVPVGGGCRKNKRSSSSSSKRSILSQDHDQAVNLINTTNSNTLVSHHAFSTPLTSAYDSNDLTLAFARLHNKQPSVQLGLEQHHHDSTNNSIHLGHSDFLSNSNTTTTTSPFVDALRNGYLETQQVGFHHNFNYGFGNEDQVEGGGEVMVLPYDHQVTSGDAANTSTATVTTTTKKEFCKGRNGHRENNVRGFWNFPWHIGGGHQGNIGGVDVDSGRECWNGIGSSWHGLINSPLM